ncbi:hypothetical protein V2A85_12705 [Yersinia sp. 1252 StPb PI]|uniref:glycine-rich domain-containing protein n=1 Tax=Yersinia sp. 1252 StPb PI TaxID=3117404 RepID=UPI003B27CCC2
MNQILYELSSLARWASAGALNVFDSTFGSDIAGYPKGAVLSNSTFTGCWLNTVDANTSNPENTDGTLTGWVPAFTYGTTAITGLAAANVTLTALQAANERITLAGTLTANINLIFPAWKREWTIVNNCAGNFSVTAKTTAGTGVAIPSGMTASILCDGTNIYQDSVILGIPGRLMGSPKLFSSSATYTPTAGCKLAIAELVGGGGGGGGCYLADSTGASAGGGGGGGGYSLLIFNNPVATTITIGAGGAMGLVAANSSPANGSSGSDTTFGSLATAKGGYGGLSAGWAVATGTGDMATTDGGGGGVVGTGAYSSAGAPGNRGLQVKLNGSQGFGGDSKLGNGGQYSQGVGSSLISPTKGGGGAGNYRASGTTYAGSNGASGYCVVWEYF